MYACYNSYAPIVWFLAEHGANINVRDRNHKTCLHWAARYNNVKIMEILFELGINTCAKDIEGNTALTIAKKNQNFSFENKISKFV